jgi:phospholipid/cholesterol/gamma-HCH transport system permease protein
VIALVAWIGRVVLGFLRETGGTTLLGARCARASVSRRMEWREALRQGEHFGVGSLLVLSSTAALVGGILVVQAGLYVKRFGIEELVGWFVGFGVLREVGPLVAGLVFSGRVGSRNAAEIAAMVTRDQVEGLRAVGVDVVPIVIAPRAVAMTFSLLSLYLVGSVVSIVTAAVAAWGLLNIDGYQFERSFRGRTLPEDLWMGLVKSAAFAVAVALISCRSGLTARGGASAVGDAAKNAVVRAAFAIVVLDLVVAQVLG